jgi:hypothetical protein
MCGRVMHYMPYSSKVTGCVVFGCRGIDTNKHPFMTLEFLTITDEREACKAWDKSLIGQLRKRYHDIVNHKQVVINFMDIVSRMFGGDQ